MAQYIEAGRAGRGRTSEVFLGGKNSENTAQSPINQQAAWLFARYNVGCSHARVLAEHAFARSASR